jgi:hypothetical protein
MGLRDIKIPRTTVAYEGETIAVRGLAFSDIVTLADTYGPQMAILFGKVQSGQSLESTDVRSLIGTLAKEFPGMVAACIALAADEYDDEMVALASSLPFNTQLECVEAIFNRTFASEADVKKLIESLTRMMAGVSGALAGTPLSSLTGTGGSAAA